MNTVNIRIEIEDIDVENGYYELFYRLYLNDELYSDGVYGNSYEGWEDKDFEEYLEQEGFREILVNAFE